MQFNVKYKYIIVMVLILLVGVAITTFAYFNADIIGTPAGSSGISTGVFDLSISDSTLNVSNLAPIYDTDYKAQAYKKTFTVTNSVSSTLNVCSSIYLDISSISESLKSQYLKYKIVTSNQDTNSGDFLQASVENDITVINSIFFEAGDTITFDLYIWISYADGVDQTNMLNSSVAASVKVVGKDKKTLAGCLGENALYSKILSDNTVYADNVSSTYVSSASGIDFKAKSTLTNGQGLYTNNKLEDGKNTYFRGGSFCAYTDYTLEDLSGAKCKTAGGTWSGYNCNLNTNRTTCATQGFTYYDLKNNVTFAGHKWKIIRIDENNNIRMILADDSVSLSAFNSNSNDNAHVGYMYGDASSFQETETATPSSLDIWSWDTYYYGTTYAKNESNKYYLTGTMVSGKWNTESICTSSSCPVANYYTCKSTSSSGTCATLYKITSWNSTNNANGYTRTYASQSYNQAHTNTNNSTMKTAVDNWYNANLTNYRNYLTDAGYCSDRSLTSGPGYGVNGTNYKPYTRNYPDTSASPRLSISASCSNPSRDLFTTQSSTIGNKALTNPIGLITSDEARYAGMVYYGTTSTQYNFTNYLKFNGWYWTMSPMYYSSSSSVAFGYSVYTYGFFDDNLVYNAGGLRASVSLKSSTSVISGSGTYDNPYVIN